MLMRNKLCRLAVIFTTLLAMHVQVHAFFWSDWHDPIEGAGTKDLPFVQGKPTKDKYRGRSCAFCTTGSEGQGAVFSTDGKERNYGEMEALEKKIVDKSELLLQQVLPKSQWVYLGKTFMGNDRYFYPIRIFVPSIDPLILITTPWSYKSAMQKNFDGHGLTDEAHFFYDWETTVINNQRRTKRIMLKFGNELFIPFEIRSTLPKEISQIQIISNGFQQSLTLPMQPSDEAVTVDVNQQKMSFSRSENGKTLISFDNK